VATLTVAHAQVKHLGRFQQLHRIGARLCVMSASQMKDPLAREHAQMMADKELAALDDETRAGFHRMAAKWREQTARGEGPTV
jgi:hypothetical protein